jgi:hypothetical protein|tara:strand:- start:338 stop:535 length:198 start_codon:yes stop_codon:yes gene_type:complete
MKKKQGYLDREAESVGAKNSAETEVMRIERLSGMNVQTARDRARESRGARKADRGTGKGEYGFKK